MKPDAGFVTPHVRDQSSEVVSKCLDKVVPAAIPALIAALRLDVRPLDVSLAMEAGMMRLVTARWVSAMVIEPVSPCRSSGFPPLPRTGLG